MRWNARFVCLIVVVCVQGLSVIRYQEGWRPQEAFLKVLVNNWAPVIRTTLGRSRPANVWMIIQFVWVIDSHWCTGIQTKDCCILFDMLFDAQVLYIWQQARSRLQTTELRISEVQPCSILSSPQKALTAYIYVNSKGNHTPHWETAKESWLGQPTFTSPKSAFRSSWVLYPMWYNLSTGRLAKFGLEGNGGRVEFSPMLTSAMSQAEPKQYRQKTKKIALHILHSAAPKADNP